MPVWKKIVLTVIVALLIVAVFVIFKGKKARAESLPPWIQLTDPRETRILARDTIRLREDTVVCSNALASRQLADTPMFTDEALRKGLEKKLTTGSGPCYALGPVGWFKLKRIVGFGIHKEASSQIGLITLPYCVFEIAVYGRDVRRNKPLVLETAFTHVQIVSGVLYAQCHRYGA